MEENQNQYEQILSRILTKSPCSVVLSDMVAGDFVDSFIAAYGDSLTKARILPMRFNCADYSDSISIWKEISKRVKEGMPSVYEGDVIIKKGFESIENAKTTEAIKSFLTKILAAITQNSGWMILLILEDFENIVDKMKEHDLMKIRGMTTSFVIMTISHTDLKKLVDEKYEHAYFCNQFLPFRF